MKLSCTYQPCSFCRILKKFLEPTQSYEDVPFLGTKWPICPEQIFFLVQIIIITFIYLRRLHGNSQTLLVFYFILKKLIKNNFSNLFILSTHKLTQHIALDCKLSCTHRLFQVFCEIHFVLKQELISWLSFKIYLH